MAAGIFACWFPIPMHSLIAVGLVLAFSLNLPLALLAVWFNNPLTLPSCTSTPIAPVVWYCTRHRNRFTSAGPCTGWNTSGHPGAPFLLGSLLLAVLTAASGGLLTLLLLRLGKLVRSR